MVARRNLNDNAGRMEQRALIRAIAEEVLKRLPEHAVSQRAACRQVAAPAHFRSSNGCEELIEFLPTGECSIEPGKPCIRTGRCRELGH